MNIEESIEKGIRKRGFAFIPYIMGGFPDINRFIEYFEVLEKHGDVVEIGIPYSDPVADGPVIQMANKTVLEKGYGLENILRVVSKSSKPVVLMTYYNKIFRIGEETFCSMISKYNISGLLVPDLPYEYSKSLRSLCKKYNINNIFLIAPNTPEERENRIVKISRGFIYLVQRYGVTGISELYSPIQRKIEKIKKKTDKFLCVGFGISSKDHIKKLVDMGADGVVVGSYIINLIQNGMGHVLNERIEILIE